MKLMRSVLIILGYGLPIFFLAIGNFYLATCLAILSLLVTFIYTVVHPLSKKWLEKSEGLKSTSESQNSDFYERMRDRVMYKTFTTSESHILTFNDDFSEATFKDASGNVVEVIKESDGE